MFGWNKWRDKQEEKKRLQEIDDKVQYALQMKKHQEWWDDVLRALRKKEQEASDKHLSPFEKAGLPKQSHISNITGATEELMKKEKTMYEFKEDLPDLSEQTVVHFKSGEQLGALLTAYQVGGDQNVASEGYFWYENVYHNSAVVSTSGNQATRIIEFDELLVGTQGRKTMRNDDDGSLDIGDYGQFGYLGDLGVYPSLTEGYDRAYKESQKELADTKAELAKAKKKVKKLKKQLKELG